MKKPSSNLTPMITVTPNSRPHSQMVVDESVKCTICPVTDESYPGSNEERKNKYLQKYSIFKSSHTSKALDPVMQAFL